jgi:hypothetical protein
VALDALGSSHTRLELSEILEDGARESHEHLKTVANVSEPAAAAGVDGEDEERAAGDADDDGEQEEAASLWPSAAGLGVARTPPAKLGALSTKTIAGLMADLPAEAAGRPRRQPKGTKKKKKKKIPP